MKSVIRVEEEKDRGLLRQVAERRLHLTFAGAMVLAAALPVLQGQTEAAPSLGLERSSFFLPGDGERNNNDYIGDFCCTGETATVRTTDGTSIGYIYHYDFSGAYNVGPSESIATSFGILVSGVSSLSDLASPRDKSSVVFHASELTRGASRSARAGELTFTVTILSARLVDNGDYYDMGSVRVRVDVSISEADRDSVSSPGTK